MGRRDGIEVYRREMPGSPLVVFKNVEGHTMPVVTNVAGNRKLLALALSRRRA
jgi:UbiD family decarboxylase